MVVDRSQSRLLFHRGTNTHGFIPKKKYVMKSGPVYTCIELVGSVEHKIICFSHQNHTLFITSLHSFYFSVNFDRKKKRKKKALSLQLGTFIFRNLHSGNVYIMNYQFLCTFIIQGFSLAEGRKILSVYTWKARLEPTVRTPQFAITNTM